MKAYKCDRCDRVMVGLIQLSKMTRIDYYTEVGCYQEKHLCPECESDLRKFMREMKGAR